ncbi:hypothetical protein [Candidatus Nitrotoga sp. 1052]|uniref:hypothetical protein n=1 Tax=Candidatus Nitrotoga sp. 1052 TaxID=2886964 RepID=UPI00403D981E
MSTTHSDALVFFGATSDLAYKKIFPSLQPMVKLGTLNVPVICVARAGWNRNSSRVSRSRWLRISGSKGAADSTMPPERYAM